MYKIQDLARRNLKAINAKTAEHAGTGRYPMSHIRNTSIHELAKKFPDKSYRELESLKHQAIQASSGKPQAPSSKRQASSRKRQAP